MNAIETPFAASADPLVIAGRTFSSRLFLGTAGYPNQKVFLDALEASGSEMAPASIRRISLAGYEVGARVGEFLGRSHYKVFHTTGTAGTLAGAGAGGPPLGAGAIRLPGAVRDRHRPR